MFAEVLGGGLRCQADCWCFASVSGQRIVPFRLRFSGCSSVVRVASFHPQTGRPSCTCSLICWRKVPRVVCRPLTSLHVLLANTTTTRDTPPRVTIQQGGGKGGLVGSDGVIMGQGQGQRGGRGGWSAAILGMGEEVGALVRGGSEARASVGRGAATGRCRQR